MTLPGDVAIRTTSFQGARVALMYDLWSGWVEALPPQGILAGGMLDSADDFKAALFNLVHGFYKQSIASLRNALETMVFACECELRGDSDGWSAWQQGEELKFTETFERLRTRSKLGILEDKARQATEASIFPLSQKDKGNAWARNLYQRLGKFPMLGEIRQMARYGKAMGRFIVQRECGSPTRLTSKPTLCLS